MKGVVNVVETAGFIGLPTIRKIMRENNVLYGLK